MRKWVFMLALILWVGIVPASAQDSAQNSDNALLDMLSHIPDSAAAREFLTYADYQAILASYPDAPEIHSYADFATSTTNHDSPEYHATMSALNSISSGPQLFQYALSNGKDVPATMGFDLFGIDRAVMFGNPPHSVTIIEGNFDNDAVIAAHEARSYTVDESNGLTLLCGAAGCDEGMHLSMSDRNPANVFGGELGRSQPVLVGDNVIASSADIDVLQSTAKAISGAGNSLADQSDYRAAAEAISTNGSPEQVYFLLPTDIVSDLAPVITERLSQEQIDQIRAALEDSDFTALPPYTLVALADSSTDTEELAMVALVYHRQEDAEAAAALFPDQLTNAPSLQVQRAFGDLLDERGVTSITATVFTPSVDRSVMVLTLHAPLIDPKAEPTTLTPMGRVYRLLVNAMMTRDLGWLATGL